VIVRICAIPGALGYDPMQTDAAGQHGGGRRGLIDAGSAMVPATARAGGTVRRHSARVAESLVLKSSRRSAPLTDDRT